MEVKAQKQTNPTKIIFFMLTKFFSPQTASKNDGNIN